MFDDARLRLTLWFAGAFAAIILVIGIAVLFSARAALYDQVNGDLRSRANPILRTITLSRFDPTRLSAIQFATAGGYFYAVTGPGGNTLEASAGIEEVVLPSVSELKAAASSEPAYLGAATTEGDNLRLYVQPVQDLQGRTYYFQVGRSIEPEQDALKRLVFILIAGGAAGFVLSIGGGYWIAGRALRPIKRSVDAQREFVADASHELRTPLALIRANAEILKMKSGQPVDMISVDDIIKESDRLGYLVSQMLTLARSDTHDVKLDSEPVDLGLVSTDVTRQMQLLANEKGISLAAQASGNTIVLGNEQRLGELLIILLDNAIKYTDDGGSVKVAVGQHEGRVQFSVSDTGRGIPADALPRVFDRFYRADKARSREMGGTGLGLAIAKWIVDSHDGTIALTSEPGRGTTVTVVLPAALLTTAEETNAAVVDAAPDVIAPDAPEAGA